MAFNDNSTDDYLKHCLKVVLLIEGFEEFMQEFTIDYVDNVLDDTEQTKAQYRWMIEKKKEFKFIHELAEDMNWNDSSMEEFVNYEQHLQEMVDILKENERDGKNYSEDLVELANYIESLDKEDSED